MGYSAGEAGRLADVMAAASSNANTNVEMMGETFKYAAPVAGSLGYSMEDTAVAIGLMANAGIKGSQAGTALRSIMSRLSTDAGASSKQLGALGILTKKLGVEFYNADGTTRDFMDVMSDLRVKWKELSVEEQANYGKKIAGQEALSGLLAIMNAAPSDFEKLSSAVENSTGTAQKMADTMQNNLGGDLTKLGSKLEGVQIALYEKLEPALRSGTKALDGLLDVVNFIIDHGNDFILLLSTIGIIIAGWKIGKAIQGVVQGFQTAQKTLTLFAMETNEASIAQRLFNGALTLGKTLVGLLTGKVTLAQLATTGLAKAQKVLNAVMKANSIALIVLAIAALVAIFVTLWNKCDWFRNFWIGLWEGIKSAFETVWNAISTFFTETIPNAFQSLLDKISEIGNNIKTFFEELWNNIVSFFTEGIPSFIQSVIQWISDLPYKIGYLIGQILGYIIQFGINAWNWVTVELPQIIQGIIDWFAGLPGRIWEWLVNVVTNIIAWGKDMKNKATTKVSEMITAIINWFKSLPSKIWTWLQNTINKVADFGKKMAQKGKTAAKDLFDAIVNKIKDLPGEMLDMGKNIVDGIWNGIKNAGDWIKKKVGEFAKGILDGMKKSLGIHSPSTLFRDEVGKFIPQGVAVGIEADTESAIKAIDNMNDEIMSEMNRAVVYETGSINANASVKSNFSSMYNINLYAKFEGNVEMEKQKVARILTPEIEKTFRRGGAYAH